MQSIYISPTAERVAGRSKANAILTHISPNVFAEQLTLKEVNLFRRIREEEFLWYKTKRQPKRSFIGYMVKWFNIFSHSLANEVRRLVRPPDRLSRFADACHTDPALRAAGDAGGDDLALHRHRSHPSTDRQLQRRHGGTPGRFSPSRFPYSRARRF